MSSQIVLEQSPYNGTQVSASLAWPQGATTALASALLSAEDAANPVNQLTMYLSASYDVQAITWTRETSFGWQGGPNGGNSAPALQWNPDPQRLPRFVRVEYDLAGPLSIGASLSVS